MSCHWSIQVSEAPDETPISLEEAKAHCRVDDDTDDDLIETLINAAVEHVQNFLGRKLITQVLILRLDSFPSSQQAIDLPYGPVQSVDAIRYTDQSGSAQTFADFRADIHSFTPRVTPNYSATWPSAQPITGAVEVEYTAGYLDAAAVPANIKHALKLLVGHWYENREQVITGTIVAELPKAVDALLSAEKGDWL